MQVRERGGVATPKILSTVLVNPGKQSRKAGSIPSSLGGGTARGRPCLVQIVLIRGPVPPRASLIWFQRQEEGLVVRVVWQLLEELPE